MCNYLNREKNALLHDLNTCFVHKATIFSAAFMCVFLLMWMRITQKKSFFPK